MKISAKFKLILVLISLGLAVPSVQAKGPKITTAAELSAKVELTLEQLPKAEAIYAADAEAIKALGATPDADEVKKIHADTKAKVMELLTPKQKAKLAPAGKKKDKTPAAE
jgi:hypothetical protein